MQAGRSVWADQRCLRCKKKNLSSASERKQRSDTCAAQQAFTLFTNSFNCRMTDELKNDPLTHSCDISQRAHSIRGCQKRKEKGLRFLHNSQFWFCFTVWRLAGCLQGFFSQCSSGMSRNRWAAEEKAGWMIAGRLNDWQSGKEKAKAGNGNFFFFHSAVPEP